LLCLTLNNLRSDRGAKGKEYSCNGFIETKEYASFAMLAVEKNAHTQFYCTYITLSKEFMLYPQDVEIIKMSKPVRHNKILDFVCAWSCIPVYGYFYMVLNIVCLQLVGPQFFYLQLLGLSGTI
jgi:hypothetical protein